MALRVLALLACGTPEQRRRIVEVKYFEINPNLMELSYLSHDNVLVLFRKIIMLVNASKMR